MKKIIWIALIWTFLDASVQGAGLNCAESKSKIELAICQNPNLSQADFNLNNSFKTLHNKYDKTRQKSLVDGQRKWLQLRNKACIVGNSPVEGEDIQTCLLAVYNERIRELHDESELQDYYEKNKIDSASDVEKELDSPLEINTLSHHPATPVNGDTSAPDAEYDAKSCREFFTLTNGLWAIETVRAGNEREMQAANNLCSFIFYSNRAITLNTKPSVDFKDAHLYSCEFISDDNDICKGEPFAEMIKHKELTAVKRNQNVDSRNSETGIFRADEDGFVYSEPKSELGSYYRFKLSRVGDYTNQGREEVIAFEIRGWATGSETSTLVLYYDPSTKSVRPEDIGRYNLFSPINLDAN